jgi:hypothetical protein
MALSLDHLQSYQTGLYGFSVHYGGLRDVVLLLSNYGRSCKHVMETPVISQSSEIQVLAICGRGHIDDLQHEWISDGDV